VSKKTVFVDTPVGRFTRNTNSSYQFAAVSEIVEISEYDSALGQRVRFPITAAEFAAKVIAAKRVGASRRYAKDGGFVVSWHSSQQAAQKSLEKGCPYADIYTRPVGVFAVGGAL
jgi:hypothetical protein